MPETLVIRLPQDDDGAASWTVVDDAGTRIGDVAQGDLASAAQAQEHRQVLVLVPGTKTVTTHARLPVKSVSKMLQVAPFALEEQLAGDVTKMHFALGQRNDEGDVTIVATDRACVSAWVSALESAGIIPSRVLTDTAGVPITAGGFTVLLQDDEACIRDADGGAYFVDHESLLETLALISGEPADDSEPVNVPINVFFDAEQATCFEPLLSAIQAQFAGAEFRQLPTGALPRLAAEAIESDAPNLLQGEFAARGKYDKLWQPWRSAATLAAVLIVASVAVKAAELVTYKNRYDALRTQMMEVYSAALPGAPATRDPVGDLRRRVNSNGPAATEGSGFLDALGAVANALPKSETTFLRSISYANNQMNLEIVSSDVPTLDELRRAVSTGSAWRATLTQTTPKDGVVEGRFQLQRSDP